MVLNRRMCLCVWSRVVSKNRRRPDQSDGKPCHKVRSVRISTAEGADSALFPSTRQAHGPTSFFSSSSCFLLPSSVPIPSSVHHNLFTWPPFQPQLPIQRSISLILSNGHHSTSGSSLIRPTFSKDECTGPQSSLGSGLGLFLFIQASESDRLHLPPSSAPILSTFSFCIDLQNFLPPSTPCIFVYQHSYPNSPTFSSFLIPSVILRITKPLAVHWHSNFRLSARLPPFLFFFCRFLICILKKNRPWQFSPFRTITHFPYAVIQPSSFCTSPLAKTI
ncbi:hypothetical protein IE53DRAFT_262931 [Violaceomyces palustris]|uniref:Uncharacterized protein n=1 Tax=Violaceomyces palustris TaxID=1673888 RepID=A0ACD0NN35_9BASI|nr:hypothetical protein IE53DRAFT_262931 [Violaceomyces palustris]